MAKETEPRPTELLAVDFVRGVFYSAAKRLGHPFWFSTHDPRIHEAMAEAYTCLRGNVEGLSPHFSIRPHPIHGDSPTLSSTFSELLHSREFERIDNSFSRVRYDPENPFVQGMLQVTPGSRELYDELAVVFVNSWYAKETTI